MVYDRDQAINIIKKNDKGNFTIPTERLYPFQWNWDSAFMALGISNFDKIRAWKEIKTLINSQWEDGMIPHIIFHSNDPDYFPGPSEWGIDLIPPTSGHSQPPILSSVVWNLLVRGGEYDRKQAECIFDNLLRYNRWFITNRDPYNSGLISIVHPWESGRDNSIDWDIGLEKIDIPRDLKNYHRRDILHVNKKQRPTKEHYDKYMTIVKFGREKNWDHLKIYNNGPFLMSDPGVQFILLRSCKDLIKISKFLKINKNISEIEGWVENLSNGCKKLWNDEVNSYCALDTRSGIQCNAITSASFLSFFSGIGSDDQKKHMLCHLNRILEFSNYGLPSLDPSHNKFDSKCYWRGPTWAIINYLIARGLKENKEKILSEKIINSTIKAIESSGFAEYFDPINGVGLGGESFSWTAAMYLEFLNFSDYDEL